MFTSLHLKVYLSVPDRLWVTGYGVFAMIMITVTQTEEATFHASISVSCPGDCNQLTADLGRTSAVLRNWLSKTSLMAESVLPPGLQKSLHQC